MSKSYKVPVIMFHSIGIVDYMWYNNNLTIPYVLFENTLKWLKKNNYETITHTDLYNYIFFDYKIPKKSIILTFDDGYLDNYVFAYPLLKKYGFKGCIFPSIDFISDGPKRELYGDGCDINKLEFSGYLRWSELQEMEKSGVFDVQSHAVTHTFYFASDKIIDFRNPNDHYYWLTWNDNVHLKPKLFYENRDLVKLGYPVFEYKPSLSTKRFVPNESICSFFVDYVSKNGGEDFFNKKNWKKELENYYNNIPRKNLGVYESDKSYINRIKDELIKSKLTLEKKLDKNVDVLCWPHGSATKNGVEIANKLGYKMNTAGRDILESRHFITNSPMSKTNRIYRLTPTLYWNGKRDMTSVSLYLDGWKFGLIVKVYTSCGMKKIMYKFIYKFIKMKTVFFYKYLNRYKVKIFG